MNIYDDKLFCVYLTTYLGKRLPMFYIGSTSVSRISTGYHGTVSSRKYKPIWDHEIKTSPELFKTYPIKTFQTRLEATKYENFIQKSLNVVKSEMYINQSLANPNGYCGMDVSGRNNPMYGMKMSDQTKEKIRSKKIGVKMPLRSQEYRNQVSQRFKGRISPTKGMITSDITKKRISEAKLGKKAAIKHCPYCGRDIGGESNFLRWHGDSCKLKVLASATCLVG